MPRPRKKEALSSKQKLEAVNKELDALKLHLEELKKEKKDLEEQVKVEELMELQSMIAEMGLSIEDAREKLKQ